MKGADYHRPSFSEGWRNGTDGFQGGKLDPYTFPSRPALRDDPGPGASRAAWMAPSLSSQHPKANSRPGDQPPDKDPADNQAAEGDTNLDGFAQLVSQSHFTTAFSTHPLQTFAGAR